MTTSKKKNSTPTEPFSLPQDEYSLGRLLSDTWRFFLQHAKLLIIVVLVISVPVNLIASIVDTETQLNIDAGFWYVLNQSIFSLQMAVIGITAALLGILIPLALTVAIQRLLNGKELTWQEVLHQTIPYWGRGIITSLVMVLFLIVLYALLVIPGIIATIFWTFAIFTVVTKDKIGTEALGYSYYLVKGRWWRLCGYMIVFAILMLIVTAITTWPIAAAGHNYIVDVTVGVINDVVLSFFLVATILLLFNLEKIKGNKS